jgi:uncharacterized protein YndB with AHSA1/START domain
MTEVPAFHVRTDVTTHGTFVIERDYPKPADQVFAAFSTAAAKRAWFRPPAEWAMEPAEFDFTVGGAERHVSVSPDGIRHGYDGRYVDIVTDARIVFSYAMDYNGERLSVSLVTVEFAPTASGTHMTFTEQGAYFLDGDRDQIVAGREWGTRIGLDQLDGYLAAD